MTSQNICTAVQYRFYESQKAARVCDKCWYINIRIKMSLNERSRIKQWKTHLSFYSIKCQLLTNSMTNKPYGSWLTKVNCDYALSRPVYNWLGGRASQIQLKMLEKKSIVTSLTFCIYFISFRFITLQGHRSPSERKHNSYISYLVWERNNKHTHFIWCFDS
jgi:hypothetical protein